MPKSDSAYSHISHPKKRAFLATYSQCGNIRKTCELVSISRKTHYSWLKSDPEYEQEFKLSKEEYAELLESEAYRRAVEGYDEPVFVRGVQVGTKKRYSDQLLILQLKAVRPEKYRGRSETVTKHEGGYESFRVAGLSQAEAIEAIKAADAKLDRPGASGPDGVVRFD